MCNFVKSLTKTEKVKVGLFSELHVFGKLVNEHDGLRFAGSLFSEPML